MSIHKEGQAILLITLVVLLVLHFIIIKLISINYRNYIIFTITTTLLYIWLVYFFRNPNREISFQERCVLSPADGKIVAIQEVNEGEYFHENRIQVSIFMSPFNVHVNRNPISGTIKFFKHHPGKYLVAWHPKSSTKNERTTVVIEAGSGLQILFRQIAGFVARRIKFYPKEGDHIHQGEECGFIKFGSRADVFLPLDAKVKVRLGDKVKGGISILAEIEPSERE
jgi:phosphatidylserine decarboxylase